MKVRDMLKELNADGWTVVRTKGSHRQLSHPTKKGTVTLAGNLSDELAKGTVASIRRQAGI